MRETSEFVNLAKIAEVGTSKSRENDDTIKPICDDEDGCYIRSTSFIGMAMQKEPSSKKGNRGKSLKMLPHAKIGGLVGYERDSFKRWYPDTVEVPRPNPWSRNNFETSVDLLISSVFFILQRIAVKLKYFASGGIPLPMGFITEPQSDNWFNISHYEDTEPRMPTERKIEAEVLPAITQR